jgi:hypothetical protein
MLVLSRLFTGRGRRTRRQAPPLRFPGLRDRVLRAAFKAAEDDGLAPDLVNIDHPKHLDGGAAEVAPDTGRRARALVES